MNINRHNCETFFLLYIDNELSVAERADVEKFVNENPDLKKELALFLETTLPAETIPFTVKSSLLKNEITASLQDDLLLHLDNELSAESKTIIGARIVTDSFIQAEWELLQQTKLDPDEKIVFADKQLLYRHERDHVITMRFLKLAIAALLIGAGMFFGIKILKTEKQVESNPVSSNGNIKKTSGNEAVTTHPFQQEANESNQTTVIKDNAFPDNNNDRSVKQRDLVKDQLKQKTIVPGKKNIQPVKEDVTPGGQLVKKEALQKETNDLPKPDLENINKDQRNQIPSSTVVYKKNEMADKELLNKLAIVTPARRPKETITTENNSLVETPNSLARNAAYNELDEKNNNRVLYMDEEKVNKSKLSGFFRKVKRVLVRNTKIKTGDGLRIGGFEIASK